MKHLKLAVCLLMAVLLCTAHAETAQAADGSGIAWISVNTSGNGTTAVIMTNTSLTDGLLTLTYDSSVLTYAGVETAEAYVAMYSVNPDEEGVVRISWVAPDAVYNEAGDELGLININFDSSETDAEVILSAFTSVSGSVSSAAGGSTLVNASEDYTTDSVFLITLSTGDDTVPVESETTSSGTSTTDVSTESTAATTQSAQTGDSANPTLLIVVIAVVVIAAAALIVVKNRRSAK